MKKSVVKSLVLATALLLAPFVVMADHADPHRQDTYGCQCHTPHRTLNDLGKYTNLCLSCHRPGMLDRAAITRATLAGTQPSYNYIKPFNFGDQANPFRNTTSLNLSPNRVANSHKFTGSDNVPEAGAQPPTEASMNPIPPNVASTDAKPMLMGSLSCYRCHNISNPYVSDTNSAPFLRGLITEDQMCFDCHRSRNTTDVQKGTHPVTVVYSSATSKSRLYPNEYYPRPVNANPANPTSQLKTKNGKVVCMTCHGVHYADSNSATIDRYSSASIASAAVTGQFSTSKGYLLKTDYKRGSSSERNVCMNCHRSNDLPENNNLGAVKNHNGRKLQNIQCTDCHGGHVEFPGYSTAKGGIPQVERTPNIYLVNRYMNITAADGRFKTIRNAKVVYNDINNRNMKGTYGVCVACHSTLPATVSQHSGPNDWNVCKTCHTHKAGWSADCTTCHGYPPSANTPGGPNGYACYDGGPCYSNDPYFKDESETPHMTHAGGGLGYSYQCDQCHKGNSHASGTFHDVFINPAGNISPNAVYTPGTVGTCTTVYCHSDGNGNYVQSMSWANGKGSIQGQKFECSFCHNYPPTSSAHPRHTAGGSTGKSFTCSTCHSATVRADGTILDKTKHVNGTKDVAFSGMLGSTAITGCSTCHNDGANGQANAGSLVQSDFQNSAKGQCGQCHSVPMATYAHNTHLQGVYGPVLWNSQATLQNAALTACAQCHAYTGELADTHVNGAVDVTNGACNTCHPAGQPVWTGGSVACESCHTGTTRSVIYNITAPDKSLAAVSGHNNPQGAAKQCLDCHARNAAHINSDPTVHTFRLISSLQSATNFIQGCTYCHNDITKVNNNPAFVNMSTHFTAKGSGQTMACWQCHDPHGTTNNSMIRSQIAYINSTSWTVSFLNRSTAMINKTTNRGLCQVCHTQTSHYRAGQVETGHPDKNCFLCHRHNNKGGAFKPVGGCNGCHGYPPVPKNLVVGPADPNNYKGTFGTPGNYESALYENYSGGGGAHLWHVPSTAKQSDGWINCSKCHSGGQDSPSSHMAQTPVSTHISNVTLNIDPKYRFSDTTFPRYSGAALVNPPAVNNTGSCVNVMCHFQPTPRWSKDR